MKLIKPDNIPFLEENKNIKKCLVAGALIFYNEKVLLIHHKKLGVWLPPGGHMEENEFPNECAVRETKEETGLDIELFGIDNVKHKSKEAYSFILPFSIIVEYVPYKDGPHIHYDFVYIAKPKSNNIKLEEKEADNIAWFEEKDIESLDTFVNVKDTLIKAFAFIKEFK